MTWRRIYNYLRLYCAVAWLTAAGLAAASEYHGQVTFGGLPVPGATVTATQGSQQLITVTDQQGLYFFPDLTDGSWTVEVQMQGFLTIRQAVVIAPNAPAAKWELKMLPLDQIKAEINPLPSGASVTPPPATIEQTVAPNNKAPEIEASQDDLNRRAADGFLINGSVNNGAASPFAQLAAFGNSRNGTNGLYNGGIGIIFDNSALDARPLREDTTAELVALSGGEQLGFLDEQELERNLSIVARDVQNGYTLSFYPSSHEAGFHIIAVQVVPQSSHLEIKCERQRKHTVDSMS